MKKSALITAGSAALTLAAVFGIKVGVRTILVKRAAKREENMEYYEELIKNQED